MPAEQICFFKFSRPLLDLFGRDFFKGLPEEPGVYIFRGEARRVLYVGQSRNLRARLRYYKNAQPEREPRRIIRLVHQTKEIEIQRCATPAEARHHEVSLIREHRPKYNIALTKSRTYSYFLVAESANDLQLAVSMNEPLSSRELWTGAFRSHGLCRRALRALGRALWLENRGATSVYDFPLWLNEQSKLLSINVPAKNQAREISAIRELVRGESAAFLERLEALVPKIGDHCLKTLLEADLITLAMFFENAQRLRELRASFQLNDLVSQSCLDEMALKKPRGAKVDRRPFTGTINA